MMVGGVARIGSKVGVMDGTRVRVGIGVSVSVAVGESVAVKFGAETVSDVCIGAQPIRNKIRGKVER